MITFAMVLFGNEQINYLFVLLQSIIDTYQDEACVIVYYAGVDEKYIDEIRQKAPFVILRECKDLDYSNRDCIVKASFKTAGWCKIIEEQRWPEYLAFLDVDTLIVKRIDGYFKDLRPDIVYTYKTNEDENLRWPINSGVILVNNSNFILKFFKEWKNRTFNVLHLPENERLRHCHFWGGEDQAAMSGFLRTRDRELYSKTICYNGILLQGIPCEELNETRCVPITGKTHIIHYKGRWRPVLKGEGFTQHRPKEKCQVMFNLWKNTLKKWDSYV